MEPVNKDQYLLQSLDNALGVLSLFLQEDKLTLSQIAQRSGLNKTVAYRIVYTLEKRGYLNADREGRYRPGIQLAALGARAQMSRAAVELAKPVLIGRSPGRLTKRSTLPGGTTPAVQRCSMRYCRSRD